MKPKNLSIEDIQVGDSASFDRVFSEQDVADFARLSGDENPLHMDEAYAADTKFKHRLVHGMLIGSLCSQLVAMHLPGKRCLYLSQTLFFKNPLYINDIVSVSGTVETKSVSTKMLDIAISIKKGSTEVLKGTARVQLL